MRPTGPTTCPATRATDDRPADAGDASVEVSTTSTTEAPTKTTTKPPGPAVVESGTYVVPDQFAPGTYRVEGYWARLDANQEIIDNDLGDSGLTLMNVAPTDAYVEINGAAIALVDLPAVDPIAEGWTDGTYLISTDIAPGRYNITSAGNQRLLRPTRRQPRDHRQQPVRGQRDRRGRAQRLGAVVHRRGPGNAMRPLSDRTGVRLPVKAGQDRSSAP
jgi:hypothetical protein